MINTINEHTIIKNIKIRIKEQNCPWISKELKNLLKYKHDLLKRRNKNLENNLYLQHKIREISILIIKTKRKVKMEYYSKKFEEHKYNKKETWKFIKKNYFK